MTVRRSIRHGADEGICAPWLVRRRGRGFVLLRSGSAA